MIDIFKKPLIFDIRHFSLDDGPGIRTTVFLKGCPLSCIWCHNPESQRSEPDIAFYRDMCIGCGDCYEACPEGAVTQDNPIKIIRERCTACGRCAEACPTTALKYLGRHYPPSEIVETLLADRGFYDSSGGGVTFSGGEPTLYMSYLEEVMRELKRNNIHIAIETSGFFDMNEFRKRLLPYIDLVFFDIKLFDSDMHKRYTGKGNEKILANLQYMLKEKDIRVIPRIPIVPGITAVQENLVPIIDFLCAADAHEAMLLPYNPMGLEMAERIGMPVPAIPRGFMTHDEEQKIYDMFKEKLAQRQRPVKPNLLASISVQRTGHSAGFA